MFCWSLGVLCGLLLAVFALRHYETQHEQKLVEEYGQAMASMAASRAIDATLNHDLVSLQVILQDIADNPRALLASINDVENNLLVQAGDSKALAKAHAPKAFVADIPVHDSVAGFVTVNLETAMDDFGVIFYGFVGVSTVLMLIALLSLRDMTGPFLLADERIDRPLAAPVQTDTTAKPSVFSSYLELRLSNLALLKQQLSGDRVVHVLTRLEKSIAQTLKLYPGRCRTAPADGREQAVYRLEFSSAHHAFDAQAQALYFASLVLALNKYAKFNFVLQAVIGENQDSVVAATYPAHSSALYCVLPEGVDSAWDDLIFYNEVEGALQWVGFVPPLDDEMAERQAELEKLLG